MFKNLFKSDDSSTKYLDMSTIDNIDPRLSSYLINNNIEKDKIEWLIKSIKLGNEVNKIYIQKSINDNLPYLVETEHEYTLFFNDKKPISKGSIPGIIDIAFYYTQNHPNKLQFWIDKIINNAESGNKEAQAAIFSPRLDTKYIFSNDTIKYYEAKYKNSLISSAQNGDPFAQIAVGKWLCSNNSESIEWLIKAAEQNLTDAYYYLSEALEYQFYEQSNLHTNMNSTEAKTMIKRRSKCLLYGAQCNNGIMASYCQRLTASNFEDGSNGMEEDFEQAIYWYKKAIENGDNASVNLLNSLYKFINSF